MLTVPAYFGLAERQALVEVAGKADLHVRRVMTEPNAAALAYGLSKDKADQQTLVLDLGGGTFDVSLLDIGRAARDENEQYVVVSEVRATNGDNHLGGNNWDHRVADWLADRFTKATGIDVASDKAVRQRLLEAAERAKIELSSTQATTITIPYVTSGRTLEEQLTRAEFQRLTADLLDRVQEPIKQVLRDAELDVKQIDQVVLVGGASRMPAIGELVSRLTGTQPRRGLIPDGVPVGAAIQAGVLAGEAKDVLLLDAVPWSLGIQTKGGVFTKLLERNTPIPTKRSEIFSTADDDRASVQIHIFRVSTR